MDQGNEFNDPFDQSGGPDLPAGQRLWAQTLKSVESLVPASDYVHWLCDLKLIAESNGTMVIAARDQYTADRVNQNHRALLQRVWRLHDPRRRSIEIIYWSQASNRLKTILPDPWAAPPPPASEPKPAPPSPSGSPAMTFQSLVSGPSNETAVELARRIAHGQPVGRPIVFFYGAQGTGKTHLAHALVALSEREMPARRVVYLTAEDFLLSYMDGVHARDTREIKRRLQDAALLIIDDLQRISGKSKTEVELYQSIREVMSKGGLVVLIGDASPSQTNGFGQRLMNELKGAVCAEIGLPDARMREEIVRRLGAHIEASHPAFLLTDELVSMIVQNIRGAGRELVGAVWSLFTEASFGKQAPTPDQLQRVLRRYISDGPKPSIDAVKRATMKVFNVSKADLECPSKSQALVYPRQIAMYLCRELTGKSFPQIGAAFGGRNHATVIYAHRQIGEKILVSAEVAADVRRVSDAVLDLLHGGAA